MNRKILALVAVIIMGMSMVPLTYEQSDAEITTVNASGEYLCMTTVKWDPNYSFNSYYYYFNVGSANDLAMQEYIENKQKPVLTDDRNNLSGDVHIYTTSSYPSASVVLWIGDDRVYFECDYVLKPYNNTFFVKTGDTFSIKAYKVLDMYGSDAKAWIRDKNYTDHDLVSEGYTEVANKSKEIAVSFNDDSYEWNKLHSYCYTYTYEASGYSEPNGSATVFIAICAIVTILGLGLLILSGMKPRWSK